MTANLAKPGHLGPAYGAQFSDPGVAEVYHLRPPYPDEVFEVLAGLIVDRPRVVLDVGAGTGEIARLLLSSVDRVDALDPSAPMIARGRQLPGGDAGNLRWISGPAETAPVDPPYALITAGASLHWMEWSVVLPRFHELLTPDGMLAVISDRIEAVPWQPALQGIIQRYSMNRGFRPYDVVTEIERRGLFRRIGRHQVATVPFLQSIEDYVVSFHARNGFSRERMTPEAVEAFDREATAAVRPFAPDGRVTLHVGGEVVWGKPGSEGNA